MTLDQEVVVHADPESTEPEWAAFVAIDWADKKHEWKLLAAGSQRRQGGQLENTPEALEDWAMDLYHRFHGHPVAVCLEQSRGAVTARLMKYPHLVLYPVNSTTVAGFRQAFAPSGSKSDDADSSLLLDVLLYHRHRLRRLDPETVETRLLQMLVEQRRSLVNEKTRYSNRLTSWLKMYFPQMLVWMKDIDSPLSCALLLRWPTLEQLQCAGEKTLRTFFQEHNRRGASRIKELLAAIAVAKPAVSDAALRETGPRITTVLVQAMELLRAQITGFDRQIAQVVAAHPERELFENLPGAGRALLPRLIVAFGANRKRWSGAAALQSFSGIAPVTESSGASRRVHFRWACPQFVRQSFHEFAAHSIAGSGWARAYYEHKIAGGKRHHAAVRALAFKWIRILYRCWKDRTPYEESRYVQALQRHGSLLVSPEKKS